jgi:hypothetical protein
VFLCIGRKSGNVRGIMAPMRRLVRWAFNLAAILSLLACAATGALWLRSYRVSDGFVYSRHGNLSFGRSVRGRIGVITVYGIAKADVFKRIEWAYLVDWYSEPVFAPGAIATGNSRADSDFHFFGIAVVGGTQDYLNSKNPMTFSTYSSRLVVAPFWLLCFIMAWPIYVLLIRRLKRIRVGYANGLCRSCGYDLRATSERCPECGRVPNGKGGNMRQLFRRAFSGAAVLSAALFVAMTGLCARSPRPCWDEVSCRMRQGRFQAISIYGSVYLLAQTKGALHGQLESVPKPSRYGFPAHNVARMHRRWSDRPNLRQRIAGGGGITRISTGNEPVRSG